MPRETMEKIIKAAFTVIATNGFANATIADIASEAGVGKGTVYEYVQSKEDLLTEAFKYYLQLFSEQAANTETPQSPIGLIHHFIEITFKSMEEIGNLVLIMFDFWGQAFKNPASKIADQFKQAIFQFNGQLEEIINMGQQQGVFRQEIDKKYAAMLVFSVLDYAFIIKALADDMDITRMEQEYKKLITIMLVKGE